MLKVVAFYTIDTPYQEEVKNLIQSCHELGLDLFAKGIPSRGEWVRNCALKPQFLADCCKAFPKHDILYVDADAIIRQRPSMPRVNFDIGVHIRKGEVLSGTIYLPADGQRETVLAEWIAAQEQEPDKWDQKVLQAVLEKDEYTVYNLPAGYTKIFDTMASEVPDDEIIIEH